LKRIKNIERLYPKKFKQHRNTVRKRKNAGNEPAYYSPDIGKPNNALAVGTDREPKSNKVSPVYI
jgi:hypothetical protein